ncbi:MAG: hypothetical protein NTX29_08830 [Actinobacteria bacterium]|nr:hypothetical protein [Actinomycetota bacterium]
MTHRIAIRRVAITAVTVGAVVLGTAPVALAAPGDWTQVSQTTNAAQYPRISNTAEPTIARFGSSLQVLWTQGMSSSKESYLTAILDARGHVTTPASVAIADWNGLTADPTLTTVAGQRFLSFSGLNPGRTGAQYFATSGDGLSWGVSDGSMSATQSAYAGYGSDLTDNAGTPVWVGNPGSTAGVTWHVGTSSNPAPAGSDGVFALSGCCAYNAAVARDQASGAVYTAFYSNASSPVEKGIQIGQILPAQGAFSQAPGSVTTNDYGTNSTDPGQRVAMAARAGGGVYVAYKIGYPSTKTIRILRVDNGATLDFPVSGNVRSVSMGADPAGRIWVSWNQDSKMRAVHTNKAGTVLGSIGTWGAPRGTETMWKTTVNGSESGADIVVTATTSSAINAWHTQIERTLTVKAGAARHGSGVKFTVTDAGDPVSGATVRFGSRTGRTNGAGKVTITAPGSGRVKATAKKGGYNLGATVVAVR